MSDLAGDKGRAWIEVDLNAIRSNMAALRAHAAPGTQVMAVVKADAYGHGLQPVARTALCAGAAWVGVATVAEGIALRDAGIEAPILLLCALAPCEITTALTARLTLTIGDQAALDALIRTAAGRTVEVHIEVDTGIGRAGIRTDQAVSLWQQATAAEVRVTGLMTHFADADGPDPTLTLAQHDAFASVQQALHQAGARFEWIHMDNSAAVTGHRRQFDLPRGNLLRPGLLLYGIRPINHASQSQSSVSSELSSFILHPVSLHFAPALALYARVASVRMLPQGHSISYGATHRLARDSRVATVLIGYGDGYPRRLSNVGHMLLNGRRAPILGRVCMDQTVVDVTDIPDVVPGDVAVCIGVQGGEVITADYLASLIGATEHELTTCLSPRLPRHYLGRVH